MINRKISDYQKLHIEIEALKVEIEFLKTFADPPDINTGQTVRDELRAHNAALVGALEKIDQVEENRIMSGPGTDFVGSQINTIAQEALFNPDIQKYSRLLAIVTTATDLYDNRLGWSEGRNPYAPPEFWDKLGAAIKTYQDLQEKE